jgi:N-acetylglucosaminyldiphosphoundecaprenol N-acetyl-beta-D-mannosaminyltransferase
MQRTGLSWLYRWWQEPRRLTGRYLKCNTQFLVQLLIAAVLPDPERLPD